MRMATESMSQGLWLMFWAWLLLFVKQITSFIFEYFSKYFIFTIEVGERESSEIFRWFNEWIADQTFSSNFKTLRATTSSAIEPQVKSKGNKIVTKTSITSDKKMKPKIVYVPGTGSHFFRYKGKLVFCHIQKDSIDPLSVLSGSSPTGSNRHIVLRCFQWTYKSASVLKDLLNEAQEEAYKNENERVGVFMGDARAGWRRTLSLPVIPFDSVILPLQVSQSILMDCKQFLKSESWYVSMGVPYRRGYLFYGPPGSGKSSFVHALASELLLDIYVVSLSNTSMSDQQLQILLSSAPRTGLLLLEDVDVLFPDREALNTTTETPVASATNQQKTPGGLTMSGFLNALDGVSGQQGKMVFMTTNYVDRLDEAMIRSGRIDKKILFDFASEEQIKRITLKFFPKEEGIAEELCKIAEKELKGKVAMSDLQGFLMKHKDDAAQLIPNFVAHFNEANSYRKWMQEYSKTENTLSKKNRSGKKEKTDNLDD